MTTLEESKSSTGMYGAVSVAWHWLTTTRYTRFLEVENARLRADNDALLRAVCPALRLTRTEQDTRKEIEAKAPAVTSFKW